MLEEAKKYTVDIRVSDGNDVNTTAKHTYDSPYPHINVRFGDSEKYQQAKLELAQKKEKEHAKTQKPGDEDEETKTPEIKELSTKFEIGNKLVCPITK